MFVSLRCGRPGRILGLLTASFLSAPAETINSLWNNGAGNWSAANQWSPARVPNNTSTDIFNVSLDGGKPANANVALDVKATINNLNLRAGGLGIGPGPPGVASLKVNGNLTTSDARLSIFDYLPNSMSVSGNFTAGPGTTIDLIENAILDVNGVMTSASGNRINIGNEFSIDGGKLTVGGGSTFTGNTITLFEHGQLTVRNGDLTLNGGTNISNPFPSNGAIAGIGPNARLIIEAGSTIRGGGSIGDGLAVLNRGTINMQSDGLLINATNGFANEGIIRVEGESELLIDAATFRNYDASTGTLTGGTYIIHGGADRAFVRLSGPASRGIVNNAAYIEISDAEFRDLGVLANNSGTLIIGGGLAGSLGIPNNLTNSGVIDIRCCAVSEPVRIGGTSVYTQTAGSINIDGELRAKTVNLNGGILTGDGIIGDSELFFFEGGNVNVFNNAVVNPGGDGTPGRLTILGNYTQGAMGVLNMELGGAPPNLYDRLVLASENLPAPQSPGTVSLEGILNILLAPGFRPKEGDVFTLISDGLLMGEFAKINGLNVGSGISLIPTYGANSFFLTASATSIPEPSSFLLITCALALTGCMKFHAIRAQIKLRVFHKHAPYVN